MKWAILPIISIFITICCSRMLEFDPSGSLIAHSYSIWGDWSAHFTFISNMLERGTSWISKDNPLFFGAPFQYPFLSHLITAFCVKLFQGDLVHVTYFTSLFLILLLPFSLFYFFSSLGLSDRKSLISIFLFLFFGGFQFIDSHLSTSEALTNQFQHGSVITQFVLFELFPQRAFLFALIGFCFGFGFLLRKKLLNRLNAISVAILFSLLAWTHFHTWIAMGVLLFVGFLVLRKAEVFKFSLVVLLLSMPMLFFLLGRGNGVHWDLWFPGWAQNGKAGLAQAQSMNLFSFWLYNTGLFFPLCIAGIYLYHREKRGLMSAQPLAIEQVKLRKNILILGIAGFLIFGVCFFFNLQPYFYDNLKLFTYAFLFLTPLAARPIDQLLRKKILVPVALIVLSIQSATAIKDYLFYFNQKSSALFFSKPEIELAEEFKRIRSSANALVLINPKHNHWLPCLTGNPVLMGYPGWLWSWGIQYRDREIAIRELLAGKTKLDDFLKQYPVEYLVLDENDSTVFQGHLEEVVRQGTWHIFHVTAKSL